MTIRPGPMTASSVLRRIEVRVRGATSPWRIVPNAPWMSPSWALSRTALRPVVSAVITCSKRGSAHPEGGAEEEETSTHAGARPSADVLACEGPRAAPTSWCRRWATALRDAGRRAMRGDRWAGNYVRDSYPSPPLRGWRTLAPENVRSTREVQRVAPWDVNQLRNYGVA